MNNPRLGGIVSCRQYVCVCVLREKGNFNAAMNMLMDRYQIIRIVSPHQSPKFPTRIPQQFPSRSGDEIKSWRVSLRVLQ